MDSGLSSPPSRSSRDPPQLKTNNIKLKTPPPCPLCAKYAVFKTGWQKVTKSDTRHPASRKQPRKICLSTVQKRSSFRSSINHLQPLTLALVKKWRSHLISAFNFLIWSHFQPVSVSAFKLLSYLPVPSPMISVFFSAFQLLRGLQHPENDPGNSLRLLRFFAANQLRFLG